LLTTMSPDPNAGTIEKRVLIQAAPGVIFRALTDAKDLAQWFCDRVTADPQVGGELKAWWRTGTGGKAQRGCAIFTKLVPDAQVELQWIDEGVGEKAGTCRHVIGYTIRFRRGTSEVSIRDQGPPFADEESMQALSQGWISVLRDLKDHCESRQRSTRRRSAGAPRSGQAGRP
jgi:uncharacterized protein YndB with AHSA1/START domain